MITSGSKRYFDRFPPYLRHRAFHRALVLAVVFAVLWWLVGLWFGVSTGVQPWADQRTTFTQAAHYLADPYPALAFPYVPWTTLFLAPFGLLPWQAAVLLQMTLYFVLLTALIFKFEGDTRTVLLVLTSSVALDTALEINIEWVVVMGLLLPRAWSGPLLLVKPQAALGYWFGFGWREVIRGGVIVAVVMVVALIVWPGWPGGMLADIQANTLGDWGSRINMAPEVLLPKALSWGIGVMLAILAYRRSDVILGVMAWLFFVPYTTFYGLMPAFTLAAVRWPKAAFVFSLATWLLYGRVLLPFLFGGG